ncbi:NAD-dependent epimerase/dehydratase family protein [Bordetella flabilis]
MQSTHDLREAIDGTDAVVHLVSTTLPKVSNDDPIYDVTTNVVATLQMLNVMLETGVRRIVFISSGGTVYGIPQQIPITESHPTEPEVSYGITKLTIEKYLYLYSRLHGIRPTILRVANPYGERQRVETAQGAVAAFIRRALAGDPIEIWGDGSVVRDYLHVSDVADAFAAALAYQGDRLVFNVSSGIGTSLVQLVGSIETVLGRPLRVNHTPGREFDVPVSILSNALAQSELGWKPRVALEDGLRRTIRWIMASSRDQDT